MTKQHGFSLIELLVVVGIILTIAAIAIPNVLRARMAANEAAAVSSIATINTAMVAYNSNYPTIGFPPNLAALGGTCDTPTAIPTSTAACLIDSSLAQGTKSGYTFVATGASTLPAGSYEAYANPMTANITGVHSFCSIQDGVVRETGTTAISSCGGTEPSSGGAVPIETVNH
ncbi:MAG: prepilin-type N-terminal cleavage/methylation domain-containing protein [Terriglobales bacterium]|jgi:prepilin-type N-terminal cleavage/methylation domain-containing protein